MQKNGIRGTERSGLLSLNPKTGEVLWDFETKGEVMPTPAFYKNTVYITPIKDILQSDDAIENLNENKSMFSYVLMIYVLSLLVLVMIIMLMIFLFKRIKTKF